MAIRVDAYTSGGMASGTLARPGALRDALEESAAELESSDDDPAGAGAH